MINQSSRFNFFSKYAVLSYATSMLMSDCCPTYFVFISKVLGVVSFFAANYNTLSYFSSQIAAYSSILLIFAIMTLILVTI